MNNAKKLNYFFILFHYHDEVTYLKLLKNSAILQKIVRIFQKNKFFKF